MINCPRGHVRSETNNCTLSLFEGSNGFDEWVAESKG